MSEEMKTINYFGRDYKVPVWVRFMVTYRDGSICGHENKPEWCDFFRTWITGDGRCALISAGGAYFKESIKEFN